MKIVFFGTPEYVQPVVEMLHKTFKPSGDNKSSIVAVVTQSPKPVGRKKILSHSPIDKWAHNKNIQIINKSDKLLESELKPDIGILASFGEIIPKEILNYFPHGILNIHPSLLPKYRGASPVRAAIATGETETGVTIIKLDEKLDHGKIISQFKAEIEKGDTTKTLRERLFIQAAEVLGTLIGPYLEGKVKPKMQDEKKATFTTLVTRKEGFIKPKYIQDALNGKSFTDKWDIPFIKVGPKKDNFKVTPSPKSIDCFIRAMHPWPIAWTTVKTSSNKESRRLKISEAHLSGKKLILDEVQLEGKNPVSWKQFEEGYPTVIFL
ncbi:methionyl-tRNA formyltransferase [Patescibacteria group bacterium]|nr:methionyl-tRNA formyltransferase [Patescibacteria group bacterium]MBU0777182.1 methionyl-tRNA formyltransferase [Patescibacteria group bacterium]MBU0845877.1 methionyl-tRNA formyltransferase [Patescibacteria group bacterium]MBU0922904.1 methionyl-tRNA formyltransferase [Patescibacteria group bacterium]MBU1066363.1 methionyl-tRNA formyltransferase [Patescibacteria group bacterium]